MTATEKIADLMADINYVTGLSLQDKTRVSISTTPPQNGTERYVYVSIGQGSSCMEISGFGDNQLVTWRGADGGKNRMKLADLQREIANANR